jgi:alkylated DNA repair dioxygenase AlkB
VARVRGIDGLAVHRSWRADDGLLAAVRGLFGYGPGDDRATGYLYAEGEQDWPPPLAEAGPVLLADLRALGVAFTVVAFQAYRDGSGCDWHADTPFDAQAILSLGVTRTFGVREPGGRCEWVTVGHGDLVFMPPGFQSRWQHCVPVEPVPGERVSLVFRTKAS